MILLAIETATEVASVALYIRGTTLATTLAPGPQHAQELLPGIERLLAEAGISKREIDVLACGRGPGAFTGVRLAIAVTQGLALALDRPVIAISTLAALAQQALTQHGVATPILALLDARMGEVYAGVFEQGPRGAVYPISAEVLARPEDLEPPGDGRWSALGPGWLAHADRLRARWGAHVVGLDAPVQPSAAAIAALARYDYAAGRLLAPAQVQPVYLRHKVALTRAERSLTVDGAQ